MGTDVVSLIANYLTWQVICWRVACNYIMLNMIYTCIPTITNTVNLRTYSCLSNQHGHITDHWSKHIIHRIILHRFTSAGKIVWVEWLTAQSIEKLNPYDSVTFMFWLKIGIVLPIVAKYKRKRTPSIHLQDYWICTSVAYGCDTYKLYLSVG